MRDGAGVQARLLADRDNPEATMPRSATPATRSLCATPSRRPCAAALTRYEPQPHDGLLLVPARRRRRALQLEQAPVVQLPERRPVSYSAATVDGADGTWTLQRPEVAAAAAAIGADPLLLGKLLRQRHASYQAGRLRVDGRLTDRCAITGDTSHLDRETA